MKKPYLLTVYSSFQKYENALKELGAIFEMKDVLSDFWGKQFSIQPFCGRGCTEKNKRIEKMLL